MDEPGKRCLSDVCVYVIIPCNIIKSCLMPFEGNIFLTCGRILAAGAVLQLFFMILNHFLFNRYPDTRKKCSSTEPWCLTAVLGYPVAEGVYGDLGLFYASVFLIPLRLVMWSVGTGYFMAQQESRKEVLKRC